MLDLQDAIVLVEKRLVACFNYSQEVEVENHNMQADDLRHLRLRLDVLEARVHELELR